MRCSSSYSCTTSSRRSFLMRSPSSATPARRFIGNFLFSSKNALSPFSTPLCLFSRKSQILLFFFPLFFAARARRALWTYSGPAAGHKKSEKSNNVDIQRIRVQEHSTDGHRSRLSLEQVPGRDNFEPRPERTSEHATHDSAVSMRACICRSTVSTTGQDRSASCMPMIHKANQHHARGHRSQQILVTMGMLLVTC